jgi:1-acyl-sn-glycerol-3-phosphate acyltransferase
MNTAAHSPDPRARNWVWRFIQLLMQNIFVFALHYRIRGTEHLPQGGALLLINHQSVLDPLVVAVALQRPVSYLARHELFSIPVIGWILKNTYVMPIHRHSAGTESIRHSIERLHEGYYVGIFPEGTRSADGKLHELKPGFLAIARRAQVPVIPVAVAGTGAAFPRHGWCLRPCPVRVVIGDPLPKEMVDRLSQRGHEREFLLLVESRLHTCLESAQAWLAGDLGAGHCEPKDEVLCS